MIHFSLIPSHSFIHSFIYSNVSPKNPIKKKNKKKLCKRSKSPNQKKKRKIFLQYIEAYLTSISGEPCVHYYNFQKQKKLDQNFSVHDKGKERKGGETHSSRRLTKSSVSSINLLGEFSSYALKTDPGNILWTSGCS